MVNSFIQGKFIYLRLSNSHGMISIFMFGSCTRCMITDICTSAYNRVSAAFGLFSTVCFFFFWKRLYIFAFGGWLLWDLSGIR